MSSIFIVDNGAYTIKAGFQNDLQPKIIPNYIYKSSTETYIGSNLGKCSDPSGLYISSPFERGYLVHLDIENEIWQETFCRQPFKIDFGDTKLVLTDPNVTIPTIDTNLREVLFETYGFHSLQLTSSPGLVAQASFQQNHKPHSLVIDAGHSFTHIIPCLLGKICVERSMRIDVGGKYMTNFLRDKISYSQIDLKHETRIVGEMKEDCCYFARNFKQELKIFQDNKNMIEYYLPDYNLLRRGQIKTSNDPNTFQTLTSVILGSERIVPPEAIFHPKLLTFDQIGLTEAINRTCNGVFPYDTFGKYMLRNIIVFGGSAAIPGLKERLVYDLANANAEHDGPINMSQCIHISSNPVMDPWFSAQYLANNSQEFTSKFVSKNEYEEFRNSICDQRFKDYAPKEWYEHSENIEWVDDDGHPLDASFSYGNGIIEKIRPEGVEIDHDIPIIKAVINDKLDPMDVTLPLQPPPPTQPVPLQILPPEDFLEDPEILQLDPPLPQVLSSPQRPMIPIRRRPITHLQPLPRRDRLPQPPSQERRANIIYPTAVSLSTPRVRYPSPNELPPGARIISPSRPRPPGTDGQTYRRILIRSAVTSPQGISRPHRPAIMRRAPIPPESGPPPTTTGVSEMPILQPEIRPQTSSSIPIVMPRRIIRAIPPNIQPRTGGVLQTRRVMVRRILPARSGTVVIPQGHHPIHIRPGHPPPPRPLQQYRGLEEEYESGESGPSTPNR